MNTSGLRQRLWQRLDPLAPRLLAWIDRQPRIIRPAIFGAAFIWLVILLRGGLIVLPIVLVIGLFTDPQFVLRFLIVALILAPGSGFVGGLLYGIMSPLVDRLGVLGAVTKFSVAASVYLFVLVVAIVPVFNGKNTLVAPDSGDWWFIGLFGVLLGIVFTYNARRDAA